MATPAERILKRVSERKQATLSRADRCFIIDGYRWQGLHVPLTKCFYKNYNWATVYNNRTRSRTPKNRKASTLKRKGRGRGKSLHRQMEIWAECEIGMSPKTFKNRVRRPDPAVLRMIEKIQALGIKPVKPEQPIYDDALGICTPADLLGTEISTGKAVSIDYKFGYVGTATGKTGTMSAPFQKWTNCATNQWQMFLAAQSQMFHRNYDVSPDELKLMVLWDHEEKTPEQILLSPLATQSASIIYDTLKSRPRGAKRKKTDSVKKKTKKSSKQSSKKKKPRTR